MCRSAVRNFKSVSFPREGTQRAACKLQIYFILLTVTNKSCTVPMSV